MKSLNLPIFSITYKVTFKRNLCHSCMNGLQMCCPHFLMDNWRSYLVYGRNASCEQQMSFFSKPTAFNYFNIILNYKTEFAESGCILKHNDTISCTKTMSFGKTSPTPVSFTFAACNSKVGIDLSYQVTFRTIKPTCFSNPREGACEQYPVVGLPGTAGFNTLQDLLKYKTIMEVAISLFKKCHQRSDEFICRTVVPQCDLKTNRLILPCHKECEEVKTACREEIKKHGIKFSCKMYLNTTDKKLCFYKPVKCPEPKNPKHGSVKFSSHTWNSTAHYSCDSALFHISGSAVRRCYPNGTWDTPSPTCTINYNILIAIVLPLAVPIFLVILFIYLVRKQRVDFHPTDEWLANLQYDAYVAYCDNDSQFVEGEFRKYLEEDEYALRLCLH